MFFDRQVEKKWGSIKSQRKQKIFHKYKGSDKTSRPIIVDWWTGTDADTRPTITTEPKGDNLCYHIASKDRCNIRYLITYIMKTEKKTIDKNDMIKYKK